MDMDMDMDMDMGLQGGGVRGAAAPCAAASPERSAALCVCVSVSPCLQQLLRRELGEALELARVVDEARRELATHVRVVEGNVL